MQGKLKTYIISMYIPNYVQHILHIIEKSGFEAYIVGGCVRDSLLGLQPKDWDITSNATPIQIQQIFSTHLNIKHFTIIPIGLQYGTLGIMDNKTKYIVEITTYRTDGYYKDGRHPETIQFATTLQADLSRRDFTINALACKKIKKHILQRDGMPISTFPIHSKPTTLESKNTLKNNIKRLCYMQLFDYYNGIKHLHTRKIVCVGQPYKRFLEDSLRIMRAIRFSAVLPFAFTLQNETKEALHALIPRLTYIANERIQAELTKLLCGQYAHVVLPLYQNVLLFILPTLKYLTPMQLAYNYQTISFAPKDIILRLVLLHCPIPYTPSICKHDKDIQDYIQYYKNSCQHLRFDKKTIHASAVLLQLLYDTALHMLCRDKIALKLLLSKYNINIIWQLLYLHVVLKQVYNPAHTEVKYNFKDSASCILYSTAALHALTQNFITIISNKECYKLSQLAINGTILQSIALSMGISLQGKHIGIILTQLLRAVIEEKIPNNVPALTKKAEIYISMLNE